MFVWYWTAAYREFGCTSFDVVNYAWTNEDYIGMCIVRPSDSCLMIPPDGWECE